MVEGVEIVEGFQWLCDHGADGVQGYLFARPVTPPPAQAKLEALAAGSLAAHT